MGNRLVRFVGGGIGAVFVGAALVRALYDAYGHVGAFLGVLPKPIGKFISSPNGTVFLILAGLSLLWWAVRHPAHAPDVASLHEGNTRLTNKVAELEARLTPRRLSPSAATALSRTLADGLANHWKQWPPEANEPPEGFRFRVDVVSVGRERETLDYRADFEKAFIAGGFYVETSEWEPGPSQLEPFTGTLTLLESGPKNQVRGIVANALVAAGLSFREAPSPIIHRQPPRSSSAYLNFNITIVGHNVVAQLVIGQRG